MCGICGVYSNTLGQTEREIFESLLMLNVYRGKDSTGVVRINSPSPGKSLVHAKRAVMPSPYFIGTKPGTEIIWDLDKKESKDKNGTIGYIGHCRAATKGSVKVSNAHPFRFENIIGVHNGTIQTSFKGSSEFETDSEALFRLINDEGIEAALNEVRNSSPAYALAWVDSKDKTLNFIKNDKRPLYFTYIYGKSTLLWSSTQKILDFALEMRPTVHQRTSWASDVGKDGYFSIKDHHLLSIPLGKSPGEATIKAIKVKEATVRTYYGTYSGHYKNWNEWDEWDDGYSKSKAVAVLDQGGSESRDNYDNFREKHGGDLSNLPWLSESEEVQKTNATAKAKNDKDGKGGKVTESQRQFRANQHRGEPLSQSERNFRLSQGCFCCGTVISHNDHVETGRIKWWNREHYACGDCYENVDGDTDWVAVAIDDELIEVSPGVGVAVH